MADELYALTRPTADRIRALLGDLGGTMPMPSRTPRGRHWSLVRCTSATAISGGGVGAQCYPAVILSPEATDSDPAETESPDCLLTLWGTADAVAPEADRVYPAVISGEHNGKLRFHAGDPGAGGAALDSATTAHQSYDVTTSRVWEDTGKTITLPSAGDYLIWLRVCGELEVSTNPAAYLYARIYSDLLAAAVANTRTPIVTASVANMAFLGSSTIIANYTCAASDTLRIQAATDYKYLAAVPMFTTARIVFDYNSVIWGTGSANSFYQQFGYLKLD
jgi:hypothetical protein